MLRTGFIVFSLLLLVSSSTYAGVHFDVTDDYIDANYTPSWSATDDISACAWATIDNTSTGEETIFGFIATSDAYFVLQVEAGACATDLRPSFYTRDDTPSTSDFFCSDTDVTAGTPFHICITIDDSAADMFMYLNGVQVASDLSIAATGAKNIDVPREIFIGARDNAGTADIFWDGSVHEVYFYDNYFLSAAEVLHLYNAKMRRLPCQIGASTLDKYMPLDDVADGGNLASASFRTECGIDSDSGTGSDGDTSGGQGEAEITLSYP